MQEIENNFEGKRYSFLSLLEDENLRIEIPVIQRDYAQGRKSSEEIRDLFLQALYEYLQANIPNRDLDFVYGTSTNLVGKKNVFVPLDGQQRLTTLFLLHWYLANISGNPESKQDFRKKLYSEKGSNFTYRTRTSSSEFCNALVFNNIDFLNLLKNDKNENNALSKTIKNKNWFLASWILDPTVKSMLTMLDSIHEKFYNKPHFYGRISNVENPIITFLYLDLEKLKLTDDLYIKMNSRGKSLTSFENFKAKFEKEISNIFIKSKEQFEISHGGAIQSVKIKEYFSFKIDTVWSNLFWNYRTLVGDKDTYDDELMNFIRNVLSFRFAINNSKELENFKFILNSDIAKISFNKLNSINSINENSVRFLIDSFDVFENGTGNIKTHLENTMYFDENIEFENLLKNDLTLPGRVTFFAYLNYILKFDNTDGLSDWMRVIRNLTENSRIEDQELLINALRSIENVLPQANNILGYLRGNNKISFFTPVQVTEESIKALLLQRSIDWANAIIKAEEEIFHKGQIGYIFDFSGIWSFFLANKNCDWSKSDDIFYFETFNKYLEKSVALFNYHNSVDNSEYLIERSILTKGDYTVSATNDRSNFSSVSNVTNYLRDYSWKRILRMEIDGDKDIWSKRRNFIKNLFDDERYCISNVQKSLQHIVKDKVDDWRQNFIEKPELIRYCKKGFIYRSERRDIQLLNASQMNHKHVDVFTYLLHLKLSKNSEKILPFKNYHLEEVKSHEDYAFVRLSNWCFNKIFYVIKAYYYFDYSKKKGNYYIEFRKEKEENELKNYPENIKQLVENEGFLWDSENKYFLKAFANEKAVVSNLQSLCLIFDNL